MRLKQPLIPVLGPERFHLPSINPIIIHYPFCLVHCIMISRSSLVTDVGIALGRFQSTLERQVQATHKKQSLEFVATNCMTLLILFIYHSVLSILLFWSQAQKISNISEKGI